VPGEGRATPSDDVVVLIRLSNSGDITLDGRPVSADAMVGQLKALLDRAPARAVQVRPAPDVSLERVVLILDRLAQAGATNVTLDKD
jgi:biopolymer transport protein ExbD